MDTAAKTVLIELKTDLTQRIDYLNHCLENRKLGSRGYGCEDLDGEIKGVEYSLKALEDLLMAYNIFSLTFV